VWFFRQQRCVAHNQLIREHPRVENTKALAAANAHMQNAGLRHIVFI
jgi:hypothetical protein